MIRKTLFLSLFASSAVVLATAMPAHAGQRERALAAIAAADAKIQTADRMGASLEVPAATAQAREALAIAREDHARGDQSASIDEAIHASALADTALAELQRRKDASVAQARESERESAAAAHAAEQASVAAAQDRDAAQDRAGTAEQQAADAQKQAKEANERADAAQQAAASSAADAAEVARDAAAAVQAQPTQVETTVTTQHRGAVHRSTRTTVRRTAPSAPVSDQVTSTTTVTPR